jgi:integrase
MGLVEEEEELQQQITKKSSSYISKNSCYDTFLYSLSVPETKRRYTKNLKEFLKFCNFERYEQLLEITDDEKFEAIRDFLITLVETRKLSYASVNLSYASIKLFYDVNKVVLNWKHLARYKGKFTKIVDDRLYTKEELKTLLEHADLRERVIVLTLLTTGMRVGGLADITLGNMQYLEEYKLYKFTVYATDLNWRYVTFYTPECASLIQKYLAHREKHGNEQLTKQSPLLVQKINASNFIKIGPMTSHLLQQTMTRLQYRSTVTEKETADTATQRGRIRKEFMRCHALRKKFNSVCIENNINYIVKEKLMGHKKNLGQDVSYFRDHQDQLLLNEYLKIIPDITIDQSHVLQKKVDQLEQQDDYNKFIEKEIKEIREENKILNEKLIVYNVRVKYNNDVDQKIDEVVNAKIEERHLNTEYESIPVEDQKRRDIVYKKLSEARDRRIQHENDFSKLLRTEPKDELY